MKNEAEQIIENAKKLNKSTEVAAFAIELVTGKKALSLCCWCAETDTPDDTHVVYRVHGGECSHCSYVGRDTLVCLSLR